MPRIFTPVVGTRILVIDVISSINPKASRLLPEPLMGNMKKETPGWQEKYIEKQRIIQEEALSDPVFADPFKVSAVLLEIEAGGKDYHVEDKVTNGKPEDILELLQRHRGEFWTTNETVSLITGVHPVGHSRILLNYCIRNKLPVPPFLVAGNKVHIWNQVGATTKNEYPTVWMALGKEVTTPVEDTVKLVHILWQDWIVLDG